MPSRFFMGLFHFNVLGRELVKYVLIKPKQNYIITTIPTSISKYLRHLLQKQFANVELKISYTYLYLYVIVVFIK